MFTKTGSPEKIEKVDPISKTAFKKQAKCVCGHEFIIEGEWSSTEAVCPKCGKVLNA